MCRLFGLHAGAETAAATFWLIDAPDSLSAQSHRNPDGAGIGVFAADDTPVVDKQPIAAWDDPEFASAARELRARTFIAHIRYASTGSKITANTHPFVQHGRLFAHNGVVQGLDTLDKRLTELGARELVHGDTDSERAFALITAETAIHDGDVAAGITTAVTWMAARLPVFALNFVLSTPTELWALRYPAANKLYLLQRPAGGGSSRGRGGLDARTERIHARSEDLAHRPSVVIASEPMDDDPGWRLLDPGELVHVSAELDVRVTPAIRQQPAHPLTVAELNAHAAASQGQ